MHKITKWLKSFIKKPNKPQRTNRRPKSIQPIARPIYKESLAGVEFILYEPDYRPSILCPDEHTKWFERKTSNKPSQQPEIIKHVKFKSNEEDDLEQTDIEKCITTTKKIHKKKWWQFWK